MTFTLIILGFAAISFWVGFVHPPHALQYKSQAAFLVFVLLAGFVGYFAWRESRTVAELAELIDPVPEITDVTYVPTSAESEAIARFMASVPYDRRIGYTQDERRGLAERAAERTTDYWLIRTALSTDSVLAFYREAASRSGWTTETDEPPWLLLSRADESLVIFASDDFPRPGTKVLYGFTAW